MIDISQDKGYTMVRLKQAGNEWHLTEIGWELNPGEGNFYVDFENGTIYVDEGNSTKTIIGYYAPSTDGLHSVDVFNRTKSRIIGSVGNELIQFRAREADYSAGRYMADTEYLAYYTENGTIRPKENMLSMIGSIQGSVLGGAAAFVALFNAYNFKSIYCDYFDLDKEAFKRKYPSI